MFRSRIWLITLSIVFLAGLGIHWLPGEEKDFLTELKDRSAYDDLKGRPLSDKYSQMESLKVVYDVRNKKLYFTNSIRYQYHFYFCQLVLHNRQDHFAFNHQNYSKIENRRYLLGNLNYFRPLGKYLLEFSVADNISIEQIELFHKELLKHSFLKQDQLHVLLQTVALQKRFKASGSVLPFLTPETIYAGQKYQAVQKGSTYGYLRQVDASRAGTVAVGERDIVVLRKPVDALSPAAGVISTEFQTPLSHLTLLCRNRGTPMMVWRGAQRDSLFDALDGQLVQFKVFQDTFVLEPASLDMAEESWNKRKTDPIVLKADLSVKELVDVKKLSHNSVNIVGGKAANFAELRKVKISVGASLKLPEGAFAIPFFFYQQHLEQHGLDKVLTGILERYSEENDRNRLEFELDQLREDILSSTLDSTLLQAVEQRIKEGAWNRMRFRSSTNAEDIAGFNGAGLYKSKTGIPGDEKKGVAKAIKKVWASLWRINAFLEREHFQMNQSSAKMGILVHRSFPDETANGVAITKNLYRDDYYGFVINVQAGEASVVEPDEGVTCDQIICYSDNEIAFFNQKQIVEYITRTNLQEGPVLSEKEVITLTRQLAAIKKHFYYGVFIRRGKYEDFAMDVEFKIYGPERKLYIKQARLFSI